MRRGSAFQIPRAAADRTAVSFVDARGRRRAFTATPELLLQPILTGRPSRRPATHPLKRNTEGFYWFEQTTAHIWHESMTEYTALMLLDHTEDIAGICTQPMRIDFSDGTSHFPDGFVIYADGRQQVFDVRPADLVDADAVAQFTKTAAVCAEVGWTHRLVVDITLPHRHNLELLAGYRHPRHLPTAALADQLLHEAAEPTRFGQLWARVRRHTRSRAGLYNLLWHRELTFDMLHPLTMNTPIWRP
ncbi:TnsA-like heteromeric transposase endonuclease subunit [Curtobacterium luteum]|uniref:TnsA-like heteromeric transposase endonuclease subunit n=1 Tax=Curtobacterium luteum TaxID=33881 RepID=UPI00380D6740